MDYVGIYFGSLGRNAVEPDDDTYCIISAGAIQERLGTRMKVHYPSRRIRFEQINGPVRLEKLS